MKKVILAIVTVFSLIAISPEGWAQAHSCYKEGQCCDGNGDGDTLDPEDGTWVTTSDFIYEQTGQACSCSIGYGSSTAPGGVSSVGGSKPIAGKCVKPSGIKK